MPPSYQKVNPADAPILYLALTSNDAAAVARSTSTPRRTIAQRISMVERRRAGAACTARRSTPCASSSIRSALATRGIGIDEVATAVAHAEREPADRRALRAEHARYTVQANGQLDERGGSSGDMIVAYRNGAPVRLGDVGQRASTTCRTTRRASWYNGERGDRARRSSGSRARTRSTVADARQGGAARSSSAELPPSRRDVDRSTTASATIRESVHDVKFTLDAHARARRAGDLPVPAQRVGDDHPEPRAADVDHRHVRGDVPARLQPRQPVADGAHARRSASSSTTRS